MNVKSILYELKVERDSVTKAIVALEQLDGVPATRRIGRPPKAAAAPAMGRRRHISPAARARMSRLMKQRWAARKRAGKSRL